MGNLNYRIFSYSCGVDFVLRPNICFVRVCLYIYVLLSCYSLKANIVTRYASRFTLWNHNYTISQTVAKDPFKFSGFQISVSVLAFLILSSSIFIFVQNERQRTKKRCKFNKSKFGRGNEKKSKEWNEMKIDRVRYRFNVDQTTELINSLSLHWQIFRVEMYSRSQKLWVENTNRFTNISRSSFVTYRIELWGWRKTEKETKRPANKNRHQRFEQNKSKRKTSFEKFPIYEGLGLLKSNKTFSLCFCRALK